MVERLKEAIAKATSQRSAGGAAPRAGAPAPATPSPALWDMLPRVAIDPAHLARNRIITADRSQSAYLSFDLLRSRLMVACQEKGWRRLAITSATKGCGKSVVTANLAFSFARHRTERIALVDLDLRAPALAGLLGATPQQDIGPLLLGHAAPAEQMVRVDDNLAAALNRRPMRDSAELLQSISTATALDRIQRELDVGMMLVDLPPMLVSDDALNALAHMDCVLMVIGGGQSRAAEIIEAERLLEGRAPFLGVVLNMAERQASDFYDEYYAAMPE